MPECFSRFCHLTFNNGTKARLQLALLCLSQSKHCKSFTQLPIDAQMSSENILKNQVTLLTSWGARMSCQRNAHAALERRQAECPTDREPTTRLPQPQRKGMKITEQNLVKEYPCERSRFRERWEICRKRNENIVWPLKPDITEQNHRILGTITPTPPLRPLKKPR